MFCQEYKSENLIWPLLLNNVNPDMRIVSEETENSLDHCNISNFGLLSMIKFVLLRSKENCGPKFVTKCIPDTCFEVLEVTS